VNGITLVFCSATAFCVPVAAAFYLHPHSPPPLPGLAFICDFTWNIALLRSPYCTLHTLVIRTVTYRTVTFCCDNLPRGLAPYRCILVFCTYDCQLPLPLSGFSTTNRHAAFACTALLLLVACRFAAFDNIRTSTVPLVLPVVTTALLML
jgi:hypothetical protein